MMRLLQNSRYAILPQRFAVITTTPLTLGFMYCNSILEIGWNDHVCLVHSLKYECDSSLYVVLLRFSDIKTAAHRVYMVYMPSRRYSTYAMIDSSELLCYPLFGEL